MSLGKEEESTTESTTRPAEFLEPTIQRAAARAEDLSDRPRTFFPGEMFAGRDDDTLASMDALRELADSGSMAGLGTAGADALRRILSTDPNDPDFLRSVSEGAVGDAIAGNNAQFGLLGRTGSGLAAEAGARGVTRAIADERNDIVNQQLQALGLMPSATSAIRGAERDRAQILGVLGQSDEQLAQQRINEDIARFNFEQNEERDRVNELLTQLGVLAPISGGTSTQVETRPDNSFMQLLGMGTKLALAPMTGGGSVLGSLVA